MSAITLVNAITSGSAPTAEFRVHQGDQQIARIGVAAGGRAAIPTGAVHQDDPVEVGTAQQWIVYAIVNGITTPTVTVANPNATITAVQDNNDDGVALQVS